MLTSSFKPITNEIKSSLKIIYITRFTVKQIKLFIATLEKFFLYQIEIVSNRSQIMFEK